MPAWAEQDKGKQWGKQGQKSTQSLSLGPGVLSYQPLACGYTIRRWEKIGAGKEKSTFQRDWVSCGALSIPCHCFTFLWPCAVPFCLFLLSSRSSDADPVSLCFQGSEKAFFAAPAVWSNFPLLSASLTPHFISAHSWNHSGLLPPDAPAFFPLSYFFKVRKLIRISKSIH